MLGRILRIGFIIFFCVSAIGFFRPVALPVKFQNIIYYLSFLSTVLFIILQHEKSGRNVFSTPMIFILIGVFFSAFFATIYWYQSLLYSFLAISFYLSYILFFLLLVWKMPVIEIERIVIVLGIFYMVIYAISLFVFPRIIFGGLGGNDRGFQTAYVAGIGFLFLFNFYSLSQLLKFRNLLWSLVYLVTLVFIILSLTRSYIVGSIVISILFTIRKTSLLNKVIAVIFIVSAIYILTEMDFFKILVAQTINQAENIQNDIRFLSAQYYLNEFSPNIYNRIFGNGVPGGGSDYSVYSLFVEKYYGYYQTDIGYIGFYSRFGFLAIIGYLLFLIRTVKISIPDDYLYCKYFLFFIFSISLIVDAPFNTSFIPVIVLAAFILNSKDSSREENTEISESEELSEPEDAGIAELEPEPYAAECMNRL